MTEIAADLATKETSPIPSTDVSAQIKSESENDENALSKSPSHHQVNGHAPTNGIDAEQKENEQATIDHPDAPPSKRRKLVESDNNRNHKASPRAVSPPWKSVQAEGPTSFLEDGKRRSGRTNAVPLALQPQSRQRQTRAAYDRVKTTDKHVKPVYTDKQKSKASLAVKSTPVQNSVRHIKTPSSETITVRRGSRPSSKNGPPSSPVVKKEPVKKIEAKPSPKQEKSTTKRKSVQVPTKSKRELIKELKKEIKSAKMAQAAESEPDPDTDSSLSPSPSPTFSDRPLFIKKVSFKVNAPKPGVHHPNNIPRASKYESLEDLLIQEDTEDPAYRPPMTPEKIRREAARRLRVQRASDSGKLGQSALPQKQSEPPRQYAHHDHLLAHAHHFRSLMRKEHKDHRRQAEFFAHECKKYLEAKLAKGRGKTIEEIQNEQFLLWITRYKIVVKDVAKLWLAVETEVNAARVRQYEQEQQEKIKGHLNRVLDRTDAMLKRHETDLSDSETGQSDDISEDTDDDNSEQMSGGSDSESSVEDDADPDAGLTAEELKAKYEGVPHFDPDSADPSDRDESMLEVDESDESDPETVMDSELDSDEDDEEDEDDDDDGDDDESDDGGGGLLSLFSRQEVQDMTETQQQADDNDENEDQEMANAQDTTEQILTITPEQEDVTMNTEVPMPTLVEDITDSPAPTTQADGTVNVQNDFRSSPIPRSQGIDSSREQSDHNSPGTSVTKVTELESTSSVERLATEPPLSPGESVLKHMTPVPSLLRGTLREYQHDGLDWLANLYAGGRSGILADEMGLGKTIQSIALLAHLATTYEVWGPHLIVVPTSVMLNWEMEFKKFLPGFKILTYYGDQKERKLKRRGWMAEDSFNVVITSYQLVLQDAASFKRRKWHYMILDEAHNIKNFRSERWQTMMTFNTRARLLLTGTPLQNNLTELWSLLFFLHYGQENEGEDDAFAGLREWSEWFKKPVESILEHGKQVLDQEDQEQVQKLHKVIRPFLLRRLKADVEKQMPLKYEHVEMCRLSKRQRQLYDGFMSRAQTRETLASGNYLSIINALMQLRKVCNHPDLFETRPINTSFAMPKSVVADFEILDLLVRRKLINSDPFATADLDFLELRPVSREDMSVRELIEASRWNAHQPLLKLRERQWARTHNRSKIFAAADRAEVMSSLESLSRRARLQHIDRSMYYDAFRHHRHPIYGAELLKKFNFPLRQKELSRYSLCPVRNRYWERESAFSSFDLVQSLETRSRTMEPFIEQYGCVTPAAMAVDLPVKVIGESRTDIVREYQATQKYDPFHQARMKLSIAFPDKRLLQYDCGKLQRLDQLLRRLQAGGHRALIFTQMTKVLDILEQFLNIHGHRYLRLDGATKVEQRQILTDRFNNDTRILCFILSSRSGGLGINLTGADTVIFYDLDWNPAMDRQCTDRAHRIGQTRDVHIYRFVSEHTIESNILRKANQKQLLDDVVIQEGDFTTDYLNKATYKDMLDDGTDDDDVAGAAMDRVLGGKLADGKTTAATFEQVEDKDDVAAAKVAEQEVENVDDGDFDDQPKAPGASDTKTHATGPFSATNAAIEAANDGPQHIDEYMLKMQRWLVKDMPLVIKDRDRSRRKRGKRGAETRRR